MIQIAVVSRQGVPSDQRLSAQFGPAGGTIGRADTNTLVLHDSTVSRVHGQVVCRNGQFFIVDRGTNPMQCNGRPLGSGQESLLADGDRLVIGNFELSVQGATPTQTGPGPGPGRLASLGAAKAAALAAAEPSDDDPFADLLAGLSGTPAAPPKPGPARPPASPMPAPVAAPNARVDPAMFPDPMRDGRGGAGARKSSAASDADPFADLFGDSAPAGGAKAPGALDDFSDLAPGSAPPMRIDEMFGGSKGGGIGGDPLDLGPLGNPLHQPNTASSDDPFASLQAMPAPSVNPRSDHVPIGRTGYTPPRVVAPPAGPALSSSLLDDLDLPMGAPVAAPVPLDLKFDDETGQLIDPRTAPARPVHQAPSPAPAPAPAPVPAAPAARAPVAAAPRAAAPVASGPAASPDALYAAFLRGVKSTHQMPAELTPELMERIGSLLHSATEGTLQLLLTRTELKRGLHAEVTMIAAQANNPLKFSPTVEVALAHLLGHGVRGFMAPEAAMRDAYDDLRAHEFGVMVGMRAALAHVISRFTPDELEKKIAAKSALDALFSSNRKAKLWDQFVALYAGIAAEAEDDFHSLFGKAFLQAYQEQMDRLKGAGR